MMHAAITSCTFSPIPAVTSPAARFSIAALDRWNSTTHAAKISIRRSRSSSSSVSRSSLSSLASRFDDDCGITSCVGWIIASANSAGKASTAVSQNTARAEKYSPVSPMRPAATALPIEAQRALRPSRSPRSARPTSENEIAAIAGTSMQLAKPWNTSAAITGTIVGLDASSTADRMIAAIAQAAAPFLFLSASTAAPPGTWLTIALIVPIDSTIPISPCVHLCDARYDAMNGPNPV